MNDVPIIMVKDLHKRFGDVHAVQGVSLTVERGKVIPSLATAAKLATALEISLSRLLSHCEQQAA